MLNIVLAGIILLAIVLIVIRARRKAPVLTKEQLYDKQNFERLNHTTDPIKRQKLLQRLSKEA